MRNTLKHLTLLTRMKDDGLLPGAYRQLFRGCHSAGMWTGGDTSITGTAAHPKDKADTGRTDSGAELCSALWCVVQAGDWR